MTDPTPRERRLEEALVECLIGQPHGPQDRPVICLCRWCKARKLLAGEGEAPEPPTPPSARSRKFVEDTFRASGATMPSAGAMDWAAQEIDKALPEPPTPSPAPVCVACGATLVGGTACGKGGVHAGSPPSPSGEANLREELKDANRGIDLQREEIARLSQENAALRTRAAKAEANGAVKVRDFLKATTDLASAREALRLVQRDHVHAYDDGGDCWICDLTRKALSAAPPAPAPAPVLDRQFVYDRRCVLVAPPVAQEDAPAPEGEKLRPGIQPGNTGQGRSREFDSPLAQPPAAEPSADADLEGLIRETRDRIAWWVGRPGPDSPEIDPFLRSFSAEVARRVREPLEKEMERRSDAQWHAAQDQIENLTRKLSEVTQERDRARHETWEKAAILANSVPSVPDAWRLRQNIVAALHAARSQEEKK